jgi:hypothetical protein
MPDVTLRGLAKLSSLNLGDQKSFLERALRKLTGIDDPDLNTVCQLSVNTIVKIRRARVGQGGVLVLRLALADLNMCLLGDAPFMEKQIRKREIFKRYIDFRQLASGIEVCARH